MAGGGLCEDREGRDAGCATVLAGEGNGGTGAIEAGQGIVEDGAGVAEEQQPGTGGEVEGEVKETEMSKELKDDSQRSLFDKQTLAVYGAMNRLSGRLATVRIEMRDTAASLKELEKTYLTIAGALKELKKEYLNLSEGH